MTASLWHLFVAFGRANILGYGGGPATIPLIENEVVDHYGWLSAEEFADALAVGNTLPGPIATKVAGYVGFQVSGWAGALTALVATVGPTVLGMIVLYSILARFRENPLVAGMIRGVRPVVWMLFVLLAVDYVAFVKSVPSVVIAAAAFLMIYIFHLHPALAVIMGLLAGGVVLR